MGLLFKKSIVYYIIKFTERLIVDSITGTSKDSRDFTKEPLKFFSVEELRMMHDKVQSLKDAGTIVWITRNRKRN